MQSGNPRVIHQCPKRPAIKDFLNVINGESDFIVGGNVHFYDPQLLRAPSLQAARLVVIRCAAGRDHLKAQAVQFYGEFKAEAR